MRALRTAFHSTSAVETSSFPIEHAGTCELALWCKVLRDRGWTGPRVARAVARSEGYVNNLIRILERASLSVLARWRREQEPASELPPVCATDWLAQVCLLPHDDQDAELARRISLRSPDSAGAGPGA
jgi:hypothetical protein